MQKKHLLLTAMLVPFSITLDAQSDTVSLKEVVVTGARTEINRNNVPMTISVVSQSEIAESGESSVLPVLAERKPGMFVTERGITGFGVSTGASGGITMRGVGGAPTTGVLVLIDGHPQYMGLMGHHLPDAYATSDVERVEVIRGPASVLYGSNAMGGAVNIITRKQSRDGWSANARLMYGSYNTLKYMANSGIKNGGFDAFISVNRDRTDGHRDNSTFKITNGYARAGYTFPKNFRLWGDISIASYEAQNPGTESIPMLDNIADILRGAASITLENQFGKNDGALKLFYNFGRHKINDGYPQNGGTPLDSRFRSNDLNGGGALYQNFRMLKDNLITAGIDFKSFGGRARTVFLNGNPDVILADTGIYEIAGYLTAQQTLFGKLTVNAGIRLDFNEAAGAEWLPQIGFAYSPTLATVVKGAVAKSFRNPTIRELYMFAPRNPDLKPERMMNYELSIEQRFPDKRLSAEFAAFIACGSNIIVTEAVNGRPLNTNTGNFRNRGIELSFSFHVSNNLKLHGNYSYIDTEKPVLYAPRHKAFVAADYCFGNWKMNGSCQFVDKLYTGTGTSQSKETYGLLNARISYHPIKYADFFMKGENLSGKKYATMAGYPMPGVTVLGGVNIALGN
ncbi:MAG: TonB-dependent receptor [Prevotella sp.]|jgi:iron complex outermembrane receptor protein|nr:TonB-dependent receptor [Prevotella sp.]